MTPSAPPRILIVEDDRSVREAVSDFLSRHGLSVWMAEDAVAADRAIAGDQSFDLVVLDLMLPGEDGLSICRRLAAAGPPILMVSAIGGTTDRIVGLECGAADYLAKPFEPRELLARIRAILRRQTTTSSPARRLHFAGLTYDLQGARLSDAAGDDVSLTTGELRLLAAFIERPGRLLSRALILDLTHDSASGPFDRAVDLAVSRLRRKLNGASGVDCIETVRGAGYRFSAKVSS
jgi:two-component system OmpR family response regulator